jgi:hypothetical protein
MSLEIRPDVTATSLCVLLDRVARFAVLRDLAPILRHVRIVMTAKTARRIDVADVVGIRAELHVHLGKRGAAINLVGSLDRTLELAAS